jgi:hypothetical protein
MAAPRVARPRGALLPQVPGALAVLGDVQTQFGNSPSTRVFDLLAVPLSARHWWRWENEGTVLYPSSERSGASMVFTIGPLAQLVYDGDLQSLSNDGLDALRSMCAFIFWSLGDPHRVCQKSRVCPLCGTQLYSRMASWCYIHLNLCASQFRAILGHPSRIPLVIDLLLIFHIRGQSLPTSLVEWCGSFPLSANAPCVVAPGRSPRRKSLTQFPPRADFLHTIDEGGGSKRSFSEDDEEDCSGDGLDLSDEEQSNQRKRRPGPPGPGINQTESRQGSRWPTSVEFDAMSRSDFVGFLVESQGQFRADTAQKPDTERKSKAHTEL